MHAENAIFGDLFDTMTADATLISFCGGSVRLFLGEATIDPKAPGTYIVADLSLNEAGSDEAWVSEGDDLLFDVFVSGKDPEVASNIAERIIVVLEGRAAETPEGDAYYFLRNGRDYRRDTEEPGRHWRTVVFWMYAAALGRIESIVP
jgi:hypothetical protein